MRTRTKLLTAGLRSIASARAHPRDGFSQQTQHQWTAGLGELETSHVHLRRRRSSAACSVTLHGSFHN